METDESGPKDDSSNKVGAEKKEEEAPTHMLDNPARVVPDQEKLVSFTPTSRWQPLRPHNPVSGILVLRDTTPGRLPLAWCLQPANSRYSGTRTSGGKSRVKLPLTG
jgi:hypothetical protein